MAFLTVERVKIRKYLGYADIFRQAEPRLESAISNVQSADDGGTQVDDSVEQEIRCELQQLATIEQSITDRLGCLATGQVGNIQVDHARAICVLRQEGWRHVLYLAGHLSTTPRRNVFAPTSVVRQSGEAFSLPAGAQW